MSDWSKMRAENARLQGERFRARRDAESKQARALLAKFVVAAQRAELPSEPLVVKSRTGSGTARTTLRGWYLRVDRSSAVAEDGEFYVLTAELSLMDRIVGVTLKPSDPPLILGFGGRDGDSIDLADALTRLLPGWDE